ncbi:NUDIX domain-containing protein [Lentzea sp. NPDC058450]|uniref:NUDIX hydrolase n=1 Tax=Lentzea sp. NPDC058450 TaxID=3346505 RepID=UPI00365405BB
MADRHFIDVNVLLVRDGEVLLTRRRDLVHPEFDRLWHLPSGKLDAGESVVDAAAREAFEEVGVVIDPADLRHVHTLHAKASWHEARLSLYFETRRWTGEPVNREPEKCYEVGWFGLRALPEDTIAYPAAAIAGHLAGEAFGVMGWEDQSTAVSR